MKSVPNKKPLVTIITNTKDRGYLIPRCIESIQKQTYSNYEHIIADGGSDNTEQVVKSYNDPHIIYIRVPQGGPICQTKEAFDISKGDYITFLDDDDEYLPEKLQKQVDLIESLPDDYGFIYGSMTYYDNETKEELRVHKASIRGGGILAKAISRPTVCGTPTFMFRRDVFKSIGGTWISGIGNPMSDWALGCKALRQGWKVGALDESYLRIYVNHGSVRMSDPDKSIETYRKTILLDEYFLREYADVIKDNPKSAELHYNNLCRNYLMLGDWKQSFMYYRQLFKSNRSIRNLVYFPYLVVVKLFGK